jgi:hypothetical protein
MIIDKQLELSLAQAPTTGSTDSTNVIDQGAAGNAADALWLVIRVATTVTSAGAATVNFKLQTSADNSSYSSLFETGAIGKATLTAGYIAAKVRVPVGALRYLKVVYTVGTADLTAGAFDAVLVKDAPIAS